MAENTKIENTRKCNVFIEPEEKGYIREMLREWANDGRFSIDISDGSIKILFEKNLRLEIPDQALSDAAQPLTMKRSQGNSWVLSLGSQPLVLFVNSGSDLISTPADVENLMALYVERLNWLRYHLIRVAVIQVEKSLSLICYLYYHKTSSDFQ